MTSPCEDGTLREDALAQCFLYLLVNKAVVIRSYEVAVPVAGGGLHALRKGSDFFHRLQPSARLAQAASSPAHRLAQALFGGRAVNTSKAPTQDLTTQADRRCLTLAAGGAWLSWFIMGSTDMDNCVG